MYPGTTRTPGHSASPRHLLTLVSPSCPARPGKPGHPGSPRRVAVRVPAPAGVRRRTAGSLRPVRPPPVGAERISVRGLRRSGLIPRCSHSARGARRLRSVGAIGARRHPAPVRQPVLASRHRPAVRRTPVPGPPVPGPPVAWHAVRRETVGRVRGGRREAPRRRAHSRPARLAGSWLWRHISGPPQQLAVLVLVGTVRAVRGRAVLRPVGAAIAQAPSPGQAIGIAAQAGVATFHQVPPGLVVRPRRRTCLT